MRFTSIISVLSFGIAALAYDIPASCNCNHPGCQYSTDGSITGYFRQLLAKNGSDQGCRADVGSTFTYGWHSAVCRPYDVYALVVKDLSGSYIPTGTIYQSKELVGPRLFGLAGHNGTFLETLTISGDGLVTGKHYAIGLSRYNATTGSVISPPIEYEFVWQSACVY